MSLEERERKARLKQKLEEIDRKYQPIRRKHEIEAQLTMEEIERDRYYGGSAFSQNSKFKPVKRRG